MWAKSILTQAMTKNNFLKTKMELKFYEIFKNRIMLRSFGIFL